MNKVQEKILIEALIEIGAFNDVGASNMLKRKGVYSGFEESGAVQTAREALEKTGLNPDREAPKTEALTPAQELVYYATLGLWAAEQAAEGKLTHPEVADVSLWLCHEFLTDVICGEKRLDIARNWQNTLFPIFGGL